MIVAERNSGMGVLPLVLGAGAAAAGTWALLAPTITRWLRLTDQTIGFSPSPLPPPAVPPAAPRSQAEMQPGGWTPDDAIRFGREEQQRRALEAAALQDAMGGGSSPATDRSDDKLLYAALAVGVVSAGLLLLGGRH